MTQKSAVAVAALPILSVLKAIWNHKRLVLISWLAISLAVTLLVYRLPAVYSAEALVLVESQRIPERYVSATVNPDLQDRLNALSQQILSYSRLDQIIKRFSLYSEERKTRVQEEIVELMRRDISIHMERGMGVGRPGAFRVSFRGPDPRVVAQVTNVIANFFVEENLRSREVEAVGTSEFLESQLAEAKTRLEEQERQLSEYKLRFKGELPQQENALLVSLGQLKTQLTGVQDAVNRAQQNKVLLETTLDNAKAAENMVAGLIEQEGAVARRAALDAAPNPASPAMAAAAPVMKQSERLKLQLEALRTRYGEEHPDIRRMVAEIARVEAFEQKAPPPAPEAPRGASEQGSNSVAVSPRQIQASPQMAQSLLSARERVHSVRAQLELAVNEVTSLNRERQRLVTEIASAESRIAKLPVREQQLAAVTRDYEITRTNYSSLLDKKMAADVAADMEKRQKAERFVILDLARVPEKPIKPKRVLLSLAGCVFGLAFGMALSLGLEFKKGVLLGDWEIPAGVVVLGRIPAMRPEAFRSGLKPESANPGNVRIRWGRLVLVTSVVIAAFLAVAGAGIYFGWTEFWK